MRRAGLVALLLLLLGLPGRGVLIDSGDGSGNTSAPADDPGWDHAAIVGGLTGVYLGNGWILSADHVLPGGAILGSVYYPWVPGSKIQIQHDAMTYADLAVWRLDPAPPLPLLPLRASTPVGGSEAILIGKGRNRGAATSWMGFGGYLWGVGNAMRWGTNRVGASGLDLVIQGRKTRSFSTDFSEDPPGASDPRCDAGSACPEAQPTSGDSGGGVFLRSGGGSWELAGIMHSVGAYGGQPAETSLYGNPAYSADLSFYRAQILAIVRPQCSNGLDDDGDLLLDLADPGCLAPEDDGEAPDCNGPDADADGVGDVCDDCLLAPNPDQIDSDGDLFGNACDADYDQNGTAGGSDFNILRLAFGSALGAPNYDPRCDSNADDVIGSPDFNLLLQSLLGPPGPSGLVP